MFGILSVALVALGLIFVAYQQHGEIKKKIVEGRRIRWLPRTGNDCPVCGAEGTLVEDPKYNYDGCGPYDPNGTCSQCKTVVHPFSIAYDYVYLTAEIGDMLSYFPQTGDDCPVCRAEGAVVAEPKRHLWNVPNGTCSQCATIVHPANFMHC